MGKLTDRLAHQSVL